MAEVMRNFGDLPPAEPAGELARRHAALRERLESERGRLGAETCDRLSKRLAVLLDPDDWDEGDAPPSVDSFEALIGFLVAHPEFRCPNVFLRRRGYFEAFWRPEQNKLVSLEFQPDGDVSWMVFAPHPKGGDRKESAAGTTPANRVLDRIHTYGGISWMKRA